MDIDLFDLVLPIHDPTRERFPHERRIAIASFSAFLHFPFQGSLVAQAQAVASANTIRALKENILPPYAGSSEDNVSLLYQKFFNPDVVSELLLDFDIDEQLSLSTMYDGNYFDLRTAEGIANFLIRCPSSKQPSINKAKFFLDKDGFATERLKSDRYEKCSATTSAKAWARFGSISSYLLAESYLKISFRDISPDLHPRAFIQEVGEVLHHPRLEEFFPIAKQFQTQLQQILGKKNQTIQQCMKLPATISEADVELKNFTSKQIEILGQYRAPSPY